MTIAAAHELLERIVKLAKATLDPEPRCNVPSETWLSVRRETRAPSKMWYGIVDDAAEVLLIACHNLAMAREDRDVEGAAFWQATARGLLPRCEADLARAGTAR